MLCIPCILCHLQIKSVTFHENSDMKLKNLVILENPIVFNSANTLVYLLFSGKSCIMHGLGRINLSKYTCIE